MKKVISLRYVPQITTTNDVFMLILVHYWPSSKDLIKKWFWPGAPYTNDPSLSDLVDFSSFVACREGCGFRGTETTFKGIFLGVAL